MLSSHQMPAHFPIAYYTGRKKIDCLYHNVQLSSQMTSLFNNGLRILVHFDYLNVASEIKPMLCSILYVCPMHQSTYIERNELKAGLARTRFGARFAITDPIVIAVMFSISTKTARMMGPTWDQHGSCRSKMVQDGPHVVPINLAIRDVIMVLATKEPDGTILAQLASPIWMSSSVVIRPS